MLTLRSFTAACLALLGTFAGHAGAEPVYGISDTQFLPSALIRFDSATPGAMTLIGGITGLGSGQALRAIDFRPANGLLYAFGSTSNGTTGQLYTLNLTTAVLTAVGASFALTGNTSALVSIDFNPVADRLRVVTGGGQNYRINPNDGTLAAVDTAINPSATIADIAYTNNVVGASSTTLYGYDYGLDQLDTIGSLNGTPTSPNTGQRFVVGDTGLLSGSSTIGFDISGATGNAYASVFDESGSAINGFYRVNLTTGVHTLIGQEGFALQDFSVFIAAPRVVPEPGTMAVFGIGAAALALGRRRRRRD